MDAIKESFYTIMANGPLAGLVAIYVITASGAVFFVTWDLHRWYKKREINMLRYWFRKVRELMPKGITGTKDDHAKHAVSQACYEAIFALAAEGTISWKKEEYYNQLLSIAFDSENLRKPRTHRGALRARVLKNIASIKAGPKNPIPAPPSPNLTKKLGYLRRPAA